MPDPRLICVLVNFNGWADTLACLDALRLQDYPNLAVIVVDNGSSNDSITRIRAAYPPASAPWLTLLETGKNLGFAAGCNAGLRLAYQQGADLLWSLNNDTIAPPSTASAIVRTAQAHPHAGAIGCVLYYMHAPTQVQAWGGGRISPWTAFSRHFTAPADFTRPDTFLTGASLTLPRHVAEQVGILNEGFFMYADDSDLCLRLRRAGLPLVVAADTAILHKEGASSPTRSPQIDQFATTSTIRLLLRHAPAPPVAIAIFLSLRLANRLVRREWKNITAVCRGAWLVVTERHRHFSQTL